MALRRAVASMRRPRSMSVKSCRAALTIAEATTAVAHIESGAPLAPPAKDSVMGDFLSESGNGPNRAALSSTPRRLKPFPAPLFLLSQPNKNGDRRCTPAPICSSKRRTSLTVLRLDVIRRHQVVAAGLRRPRPPAPHHRRGIQVTVPLPPPVAPALLQRRPGAAALAANQTRREGARPPWPYRPSSDGR